MRQLFHLIFFSAIVLMLCTKCRKDPLGEEVNPNIDDILLYSKNPNGHNELYKLEDGQESVLLSDAEYDYWWPKVNPDKTELLVYRSPVNPDKNHDDYANAELLSCKLDGSDLKVIISKNQYDWNAQGVARWNSTGDHILMCAEVNVGETYQWRLILTKKDGSSPIMLSENWAIDCNFSPDNSTIVYVGFNENDLSTDLTKLELQLGTFNQSQSEVVDVRSLSFNTTRDHDPSFSPNGQNIVFSAGNALYTDVDIMVYNIASEQVSTVVDDRTANGGSMCWSKDGKYIYFHSLDVFKSPFRIKKVEVETGKVTTLLSSSQKSHGFFHPEAY